MAVITPEAAPAAREPELPGPERPRPSQPRAPRRRASGRRGRLAAGVAAVLCLVAGVGWARDLLPRVANPFAARTVDRSQPVLLKALEDLGEYRAATGHFQVIVDVEEDARFLPAFVKGERVLFVAAGTVDAGVDFTKLGDDAVSVSPDRRAVTIRLPHARLSAPRVDPARSYVFERERGVLDRIGSVLSDNPTSERPLYLLAERRLAAAAREEPGLVARAEQNTRAMLDGLARSLGFTDVVVEFS